MGRSSVSNELLERARKLEAAYFEQGSRQISPDTKGKIEAAHQRFIRGGYTLSQLVTAFAAIQKALRS